MTDASSLREKVAFLRRPESYPAEVARVEAIETHMAWVLLAGELAYRLKEAGAAFLLHGRLRGPEYSPGSSRSG